MNGGRTAVALIDRSDALLAALNDADVDAAAGALDGTAIELSPLGRTVTGPADIVELFGRLFSAVPDLQIRAVRTFPGDQAAAVEVMMAGSLTGESQWWPPTGRSVEAMGRLVWRTHPVHGTSLGVSFDLADVTSQAGLIAQTASAGSAGSVMSGWTVALATDNWWGTPHVISAAPERRQPRPKTRFASVLGLVALLGVVAVVGAGWWSMRADDGVVAGDAATTQGSATARAVTATAPATSQAPLPASPTEATVPSQSPPPIPIAPQEPVRLSAAVLFDFNKAVLRPEAAPVLSDLAGRILATGRVGTVTVTGYTDDIGSDAAAAELSLARAAAVAVVLRDLLSETSLDVVDVGAGKANPVAPNDSEANRALNRRVEIGFMAG